MKGGALSFPPHRCVAARICAFFIATCTLLVIQGPSFAAPSSFEEARRLYDAGRYGEATRVLSALVRAGSAHAETYKLRGKAQEKIGAYAAAAKDFTRYCELKPGDPEGPLHKGEALLGAGDYEGASEAFTAAIKLAPDRAQAYHGRGLALTALDRYDDAIKDFLWVLRHKPDDQDALVSLGRACMLGNRPLEAASYLNRALTREKDPKWSEKIQTWLSELVGEAGPAASTANPYFKGTRRLW
jgi:tetratricopeptide (TPR) repeat protein